MAKSTQSTKPEAGYLSPAEEPLSPEDQQLAFIRQLGQALLSLASDERLVVLGDEDSANLISETVSQKSYQLRLKNLESLNPSERQLTLFRASSGLYNINQDPEKGGWPLSALEQDIVNVRGSYFKPIESGESIPPTQITGTLLRGSDYKISKLVEHVDLDDEQQHKAFARGGHLTRKALMLRDDFQMNAKERQMVLEDADDEAIALMLRISGRLVRGEQRRQALAVGGDKTLSEMARSGRLRTHEDRLVALVNGDSKTANELVRKYKLNEDELTLAVFKGNDAILTTIIEEQPRQRLTPKIVALIRAVAAAGDRPWVLRTLDEKLAAADEEEPA